jgi:hypothetical protein
MMLEHYQPKTARDLLRDLGVGDFNATMLIETMFMAPATTEAAAAPTMLLVGQIQENLNTIGTRLRVTGYIDEPTAKALVIVSGPDFLHRSWFDVARDVVAFRMSGKRLTKNAPRPNTAPPSGVGVLDLPDVPGGILTYAAGGLVLWHLFKKKKRS